MASPDILSRQGHRLLQIGVALFLFTSFEGFAVPYFAAPDLGRSVHTLSAFSGVLLVALGLVWPRLSLRTVAARLAFWLLIYSDLATVASILMAALWGAGNETMPLAADAARGSIFQETAIAAVAYSGAPTGITSFALILWGLRIMPTPANAEGPSLQAHARSDQHQNACTFPDSLNPSCPVPVACVLAPVPAPKKGS
jgi:(hydroxyamino)benzene mutase